MVNQFLKNLLQYILLLWICYLVLEAVARQLIKLRVWLEGIAVLVLMTVLIKGMSWSCLEKGTNVDRRTPEPVKSPLSFDLGIFDEPSLHGPTLPTPSIASSPSVVAPMDVYLRCDESHESRMIRFSGTVLQQYKHTELEDISPAGTCSWEFVSAQIPNTPVLQPALSPKPTAKPPHASGHKNIMSGSDMSELALSVDSQPLSDDMERYEEAIAEYKAASKRYKYEFLFL